MKNFYDGIYDDYLSIILAGTPGFINRYIVELPGYEWLILRTLTSNGPDKARTRMRILEKYARAILQVSGSEPTDNDVHEEALRILNEEKNSGGEVSDLLICLFEQIKAAIPTGSTVCPYDKVEDVFKCLANTHNVLEVICNEGLQSIFEKMLQTAAKHYQSKDLPLPEHVTKQFPSLLSTTHLTTEQTSEVSQNILSVETTQPSLVPQYNKHLQPLSKNENKAAAKVVPKLSP